MECVGLIPARGGSKGIPGKNLAPVAGKPLLAWTVEAALASEELGHAVVSTDDDEIARAAARLGAEVLRRPPALARDETPMRDVVEHALCELPSCDVLVLLQPTSPLRRASHIDDAVRLLVATGADSVVSVVEVPHRFRPESLVEVEGGRVLAHGSGAARRQDKRPVYARNGPAVLALRPSRVSGGLYGADCRAYTMALGDSVDVDDPFDLEVASLLLSR